MGKIELCCSKLAETPYYLACIGINIYSIEELCFCILEETYILDREMMNESLCLFIENQLELKDLGKKLNQYLKRNVNLWTFVAVILEEVHYCSAERIAEAESVLKENVNMSLGQKRKSRGDYYIRTEKYMKAIREYQTVLLQSTDADSVFLGQVHHNMATAYAGLFKYSEAAWHYRKAFEISKEADSRFQYAAALRMETSKEAFKKLAVIKNIEENVVVELENTLEELFLAEQNSSSYKLMDKMQQIKEDGDILLYYEMMNDTVKAWKENYRRNMVALQRS